MAEVLWAQDNLFTVIERGPQASKARIVGAMISYLLLAADPRAVLERLSDLRTRLVTLTITADGYRLPTGASEQGSTVFDVIAQALNNRRTRGVAPFTVLSCDNLPDNASAARGAVLAAADRLDVQLSRWIEDRVSCPASMVDRITPATSSAGRTGRSALR
jgi:mannitol 2-dehydrogenase